MIPQALLQAVRFHQSGDLRRAEAGYREALAQNPALPEAHCNLGILLHGRSDLEAAARHLDQAVRLNPGLAAAWNNLGVVLRKLQRSPEAVVALQRALHLNPNAPGTLHNLSLALRAEGRPEAALEHSRRALELDPGDLSLALAYGNVLLDSGRRDLAVAHFSQAAAAFPGELDAHRNLGVALLAVNEPGRAETAFRKLLGLDPGNVNGHVGLAEALLLQGNWEEGLKEFEWRLQREEDGRIQRRLPGRPWQGEPLQGRSLLVYNEQGLGDALHFARFMPQLPGPSVAFWVQDALVDLLRPLAGGRRVIGLSDPAPATDLHTSMTSLGFRLGLGPGRPPEVPYLAADPGQGERWKGSLPGRPRVGICWRGNPRHPNDRNRSIHAGLLHGLLNRAPVGWLGLQVPHSEEEAALLPELPQVGKEIRSFQDTAGVLANLDLLISVDTSMVHLAGAMGVPTWLLLPHVPDWRWMLEREDTPWYPTLRLFRQGPDREWAPVLARVEAALRALYP